MFFTRLQVLSERDDVASGLAQVRQGRKDADHLWDVLTDSEQ